MFSPVCEALQPAEARLHWELTPSQRCSAQKSPFLAGFRSFLPPAFQNIAFASPSRIDNNSCRRSGLGSGEVMSSLSSVSRIIWDTISRASAGTTYQGACPGDGWSEQARCWLLTPRARSWRQGGDPLAAQPQRQTPPLLAHRAPRAEACKRRSCRARNKNARIARALLRTGEVYIAIRCCRCCNSDPGLRLGGSDTA